MNDSKNAPQEDKSESAEIQKILYGISHDMGAPLRTVVQFTKLLQGRIEDKLTEQEQYWFQLIQEGGEQAEKMLKSLLTYSRLVTRRGTDGKFNLRNLIESTIESLQIQPDERPLEVDMPADLPEVMGVEDQWRQYFYCVLHNARHYQALDSDDPAKVQIHLENCGDTVQLIVEDNGIGVQEKHWADLTLPFKRLLAPTEYPGIGMGLAYCNRIAENHEGKLTFGKSEFGGLAVIYEGPTNRFQ